jgi:rhodanese-related sulfurtransferase
MKAIAPGQLPQLLRAQPNLQLLVVRTSGEYFEMDALPARNVPLDIPVPKELFDSCDLSEDRAVYLLCRTGERAKKAGVKIEKEGFSPAVVVGGTPAWSEAGLPIERDAIEVISFGAAGPHRRKLPRLDLYSAWILRASRFLWPLGVCGYRVGVCQDHRFLWQGSASLEAALECS